MASKFRKSELEKLLFPKEGIDESSLTDQELSDRLSQFKEYGTAKDSITGYGGNIDQALTDQMKAYGIHPELINLAKPIIIDFINRAERYPTSQELLGELQSVFNADSPNTNTNYNNPTKLKYKDIPGAIDPLINFANDQNAFNSLSSTVDRLTTTKGRDTSADIKRLQDLVSARKRSGEESAALDKFLQEEPKTLADITEGRVKGERSRAMENLYDLVIPEIKQGLNVRGTLDSGDLASEVTRAYGETFSPLEELELTQKAADEDFFRDAAYQASLKKAISGQADLSAFVDTERAKARQESENRFQTGLNQVKEDAATSLFRRQNERALQAQQIRMKQQQDLANSQSRKASYGGLGQGLGSLIGLGIAAGATVGTGGAALPWLIAGSTAGGVAGGAGADIFSKRS